MNKYIQVANSNADAICWSILLPIAIFNLSGCARRVVPVVPEAALFNVRDHGTRVVFVIDASANLENELFQIVLREVASSIELLDKRQEFAIAICRGDRIECIPSAMDSTVNWFPAYEASSAVVRLLRQHDAIAPPEGNANVINGLDAVYALRPDVIFLVSAGLASYGFPHDKPTPGQFRESAKVARNLGIRIHGIQLVYSDPVEHFDKPPLLSEMAMITKGKFRFVSLEEVRALHKN